MKINRHNYEEYLIDFMDGNLSANEVEAVMSFLESNPDIKAEYEELNGDQLIAEEIIFDKKNLLKKRSDK
jgi:anti-sigma factor RsiW